MEVGGKEWRFASLGYRGHLFAADEIRKIRKAIYIDAIAECKDLPAEAAKAVALDAFRDMAESAIITTAEAGAWLTTPNGQQWLVAASVMQANGSLPREDALKVYESMHPIQYSAFDGWIYEPYREGVRLARESGVKGDD